MNVGIKVRVMGVQRTSRVECSDLDCSLEHYDDDRMPSRWHYEDGPREGLSGVLVNEEPGNRLVVRLDRGGEVSCDAADVEMI